MKEHQSVEELRLGYVTFTRPRSLLLGSGHWWGPEQKRPRGPSAFLHALREHCEAGHGEIEAWADAPAPTRSSPSSRTAGSTGAAPPTTKGQVFFHTLGVRAHLADHRPDGPGRQPQARSSRAAGVSSAPPNFPALIRDRAATRLACDKLVDRLRHRHVVRGHPDGRTGMRGLVECQIDLYGPDQDIHSGSFGGAVPQTLSHRAARLGRRPARRGRRVAIPGFYDGVVELTDRERELFAERPFDEERWRRTAHSHATLGEAGFTTLERVWARPTAEVTASAAGVPGPRRQDDRAGLGPADSCRSAWVGRPGHGPDPAGRAASGRRSCLPPASVHGITFTGGHPPCLTPLTTPRSESVVRAMAAPSGRRSASPARAAPGPRRDLQDVLGVPVLSSASRCPRTAGTRRTRRSSSTSS
ncbi:hypothetical protein GCM10020221_26340 [Streptomyces thioluteus]|uniref:DNA helicase n=1 Tax=Streptomyces thioluteus TaxID=66431 RepID=A0ABP6JDZ5_STRTU